MLCDICKKKEAVIHIQEISPEGKKTINLCNECAEKHPHGVDSMLNLDNLKFEDVLEKIQKISAEFIKSKSTVANSSVCPQCGWDLKKMEENQGLLGCSQCYKTFDDIIQKAIVNIHRSRIHTGKRPGKNRQEPPEIRREKLRKLESELQTAVQTEEYERAAIIRDEIASLKKSRTKRSGK